MSKYRIKDLTVILITIISVILLFVPLIGFIIKKHDVLVKETDEYLYYKEYKIYDLDSCVYKYHKPIVHDGVITNIETYTYIMGVIGKGGHWQTNTNITILFDGKTYNDTYTEWGTSSTVTYKKGNKVKVKETFYPHYKLNIYY